MIKGFITTPIEQAVASADGVDTLVSNSQQNVSTDHAELEARRQSRPGDGRHLSKVNQVRGLLPREANDPVVVKQTGQGYALMYLSFNSNLMTPVADHRLPDARGAAPAADGRWRRQRADLGGQTFAMRIWLDPTRMATFGVTANDVRTALPPTISPAPRAR